MPAEDHLPTVKALHADRIDDDGGKAAKWKIVGPGLVVAATGVGAADMVATLVAGSRYGYALLWAVIVGVVLKIILVEGAGRFTLATGKTIFEGWKSLGKWTTWYFGPYIIIWGFVYGATAMSSAAMPLAAMFPAVDLKVWAVLMGLAGFAMVWFGRYSFFEKITAVLVGIMFVTVVGLAVIAAPNIPEMFKGLIPMIPDGGVVYTLALAGGVGGTITLAAYGYWLREKGWYTPKWMKVMRIDNSMAYVITGIFVIAMLIVGAEVVRAAGVSLSAGDAGPAGPDHGAEREVRQRGGHRVPRRILGSLLLLDHRGVERRLADVRRLLGQHPRQGIRTPGHPRGRQVLQVLRPVADLPADGPVPAGQADRPDPGLRRARLAVHAVPGRDPAGPAQRQADPQGVGQQAAHQHPAGHHRRCCSSRWASNNSSRPLAPLWGG